MTAIYPVVAFWICLELAARLERTEPKTVDRIYTPTLPDPEPEIFSVDLIECDAVWQGNTVEWGDW